MTKIKRYRNRKLYDTASSAYITLPEVGELVKQGEQVQVICNSTGRDLTADTLTRLIFERTLTGTPVKLDTLQRIICKTGDGGLGSYFA